MRDTRGGARIQKDGRQGVRSPKNGREVDLSWLRSGGRRSGRACIARYASGVRRIGGGAVAVWSAWDCAPLADGDQVCTSRRFRAYARHHAPTSRGSRRTHPRPVASTGSDGVRSHDGAYTPRRIRGSRPEHSTLGCEVDDGRQMAPGKFALRQARGDTRGARAQAGTHASPQSCRTDGTGDARQV